MMKRSTTIKLKENSQVYLKHVMTLYFKWNSWWRDQKCQIL